MTSENQTAHWVESEMVDVIAYCGRCGERVIDFGDGWQHEDAELNPCGNLDPDDHQRECRRSEEHAGDCHYLPRAA